MFHPQVKKQTFPIYVDDELHKQSIPLIKEYITMAQQPSVFACIGSASRALNNAFIAVENTTGILADASIGLRALSDEMIQQQLTEVRAQRATLLPA